jgi:hypothetical protein
MITLHNHPGACLRSFAGEEIFRADVAAWGGVRDTYCKRAACRPARSRVSGSGLRPSRRIKVAAVPRQPSQSSSPHPQPIGHDFRARASDPDRRGVGQGEAVSLRQRTCCFGRVWPLIGPLSVRGPRGFRGQGLSRGPPTANPASAVADGGSACVGPHFPRLRQSRRCMRPASALSHSAGGVRCKTLCPQERATPRRIGSCVPLGAQGVAGGSQDRHHCRSPWRIGGCHRGRRG